MQACRLCGFLTGESVSTCPFCRANNRFWNTLGRFPARARGWALNSLRVWTSVLEEELERVSEAEARQQAAEQGSDPQEQGGQKEAGLCEVEVQEEGKTSSGSKVAKEERERERESGARGAGARREGTGRAARRGSRTHRPREVEESQALSETTKDPVYVSIMGKERTAS